MPKEAVPYFQPQMKQIRPGSGPGSCTGEVGSLSDIEFGGSELAHRSLL